MRESQGQETGQGWQGAESELRLSGWSRKRRVLMLRRPLTKDLTVVDEGDPQQLRLSFAELTDEVKVYEYAVLVTSIDDEILPSPNTTAIGPIAKQLRRAEEPLGLGRVHHRRLQSLSVHGADEI